MTVTHDHQTLPSHRSLPLVAMATYAVAIAAWIALALRAIPIPGHGTAGHGTAGHATMGHGAGSHEALSHISGAITEPGVPEGLATATGLSGAGGYLVMWGVMMIAMMYPASAWLFQAYVDSIPWKTKRERHVGLVAFVAAYTVVWTVVGIVPLAVDFVIPIASVATTYGTLLLGGTLVVLAAFQLSPIKRECLERCRTPSSADAGSGLERWATSGWCYGVTDLRACWALMGLMVVVGSMNLVWMAVITVVLVLERNAVWGYRFARGVGVSAGLAGVGMILLGLG